MRGTASTILLVALVGLAPLSGSFCESDSGPGLELPVSTIGVGTSLEVRVSDDCGEWPWCDDVDIVEIMDVVDQDPGIFEITDLTEDSFTITGLREGQTALTVVAMDEDREVRREKAVFAARRVAEVQLRTNDCIHEVYSPSDPLPVTPEAELRFTWQLVDSGGTALQGSAPFSGDGLTVVSTDPASRSLTLRVPAEPGQYDVTTPALSGPARTLVVYEDAEVDEVELMPSSVTTRPLEVGESRTLYSMPLLGGDVLCLEELSRTVEVTSPGVCSLDATMDVTEASTTEAEFDVHASAEGTCAVQVTIDASGATDSYEVEVVPGA